MKTNLTRREAADRYWERGHEEITVTLNLSRGLMNRIRDYNEFSTAPGTSIANTISLLFEASHELFLSQKGLGDPVVGWFVEDSDLPTPD
jgi:hypothetical protein